MRLVISCHQGRSRPIVSRAEAVPEDSWRRGGLELSRHSFGANGAPGKGVCVRGWALCPRTRQVQRDTGVRAVASWTSPKSDFSRPVSDEAALFVSQAAAFQFWCWEHSTPRPSGAGDPASGSCGAAPWAERRSGLGSGCVWAGLEQCGWSRCHWSLSSTAPHAAPCVTGLPQGSGLLSWSLSALGQESQRHSVIRWPKL